MYRYYTWKEKSEVLVSIKFTRAIEFTALLMASSEQHCKCLTCTLKEESRRTAPQNLLQGITKHVNECAVSIETNAHTFVQTFAFVFAAMSVHAHSWTRMTWIKMSKRGKSGWRKRDERELIKKEGMCCASARAHGREGIQYNCTHVYRVDGNILERILKYLLVVWVEGERCLSRCHLDCAIEAPMRPPLQNLTIKIALGLWEATEAVPSSSINNNGDRATTCFTSSSSKSWNAVTRCSHCSSH